MNDNPYASPVERGASCGLSLGDMISSAFLIATFLSLPTIVLVGLWRIYRDGKVFNWDFCTLMLGVSAIGYFGAYLVLDEMLRLRKETEQ